MSASAAKPSALKALLQDAGECIEHEGYAGDVSPQEAWDVLKGHANAVLVDVRTQPEWQFVGTVDSAQAAGKAFTICWKMYPNFSQNTAFMEQLARDVPQHDAPIFFMCRSGGRSLEAAKAATKQGYQLCFNIAGGFEGDVDAQGQRGKRSGWKAENLPWKQG